MCLWYQRKSGDVIIFIGNMVIIVVCLVFMLFMEKIIKGVFCGDDSLLYFLKGCEFFDIQYIVNFMWNFEVKLFRKQYGYFCGRYVIYYDRGCIVYYDLLKLIFKFGVKYIKDWDYLEEFRRFFCDVVNLLNNCVYYMQLDDVVSEVYKIVFLGLFVYKSLVKYLFDKVFFRSLFIDGFC